MIWITILTFLFCTPGAAAEDVVLIKDIKPTHVEKDEQYVRLELVKEIEEEINEEYFFAKPMAITVDDEQNFYVYDMILMKAFQFDKDYDLIRVFLDKGQGPAEILLKRSGIRKLYFSSDGHLYINAPGNKKIIAFSKDIKHVRDIKFPLLNRAIFQPVVDKNGNIYMVSETQSGVDVLDSNLKLKYTLLDKKEYGRYILYRPDFHPKDDALWESTSDNTIYDVLSDNRVIVFLANSSMVYLFRGNRLLKKFHIWPEMALKRYRKTIDKLTKRLKDRKFLAYMFNDFFVDKDDEATFYLRGGKHGDKKGILYQFDLEGKLKHVYYTTSSVKFLAKRNNLFYGLWRGSVYIYRVARKQVEK
jgi:hypothetical protein